MQTLCTKIEQFCVTHNLLSPGQTIIVGLSGGPDSVFLLHAFMHLAQRYRLTIIAAHLDHGWRSNSHEDVLFCTELAHRAGIKFISAHAQDFTDLPPCNGSLEEHGRRLRHAFFARIRAAQVDPENTVIALAHHQDDLFETFFIRLCRGSSIAGLASIRPSQGTIIHPLLCCTKKEIVAALDAHNIAYRIDPTNADTKFLRNRIRHTVLPALHACDARVSSTLAATISHMREADDFLTQLTTEQYCACCMTINEQQYLSPIRLATQNRYLQRRIILHWLIEHGVPFSPSKALIDEILRFLSNTKSTTHTLFQTWTIHKFFSKTSGSASKACYATIKRCTLVP